MHRIFISHAHSDSELAREFVSLLTLGIDIESDDIFCTSSARHGVVPGEKFTREIQEALDRSILVIALISDAFYNSAYCLCELGAIWGRNKNFVPVMVPPLKHDDLRAVIAGLHSVRIDNPENMHELHDTITKQLFIKTTSAARWNEALTRFLDNFPLFFRNSSLKRARGEAFLNNYAISVAAALHATVERQFIAPSQPSIYLFALDIDRQKQINKHFGVSIGDKVLESVGDIFRSYGDRFFEKGQCGDDTYFGIFLGTDIEAYFLAEEILGSVRDVSKNIRVPDLWVSASMGVCVYMPGCSIEAWKTHTHEALEQARRNGGNAVDFGTPPPVHRFEVEYRYSWGS